MSAFFIMISVSMFIAFTFLGAFVWSVKKGHYDDDYTPAIRILMDDAKVPESIKQEQVSTPQHVKSSGSSSHPKVNK